MINPTSTPTPTVGLLLGSTTAKLVVEIWPKLILAELFIPSWWGVLYIYIQAHLALNPRGPPLHPIGCQGPVESFKGV